MATAEPMINGQSLFQWRAKTLSYSIAPIGYKNGYVVPAGSIIPVKLKPKLGVRKIILTLDIYGDTKEEIAQNISALTNELLAGAELFMPDNFYYTVVFDSITAPVEKAPWIEQVKITVSGYKHGENVMNTLTKSGSIEVIGDIEAPAILTVVSSSSSATVTINEGSDREMDYAITDLAGTVIINGISKTVTKDGNNKFADTEMVEFPKLITGKSAIKITGSATVHVEYYPMYL